MTSLKVLDLIWHIFLISHVFSTCLIDISVSIWRTGMHLALRMILSLVKGNLALFCLMYTSNISKILAISVRYFKTFSTLAKHFVQTPAFQGMSVTSCMVFFFYHFLYGFLFFITSCMVFLSVNPSYSLEMFFTASFPSLFFFSSQ